MAPCLLQPFLISAACPTTHLAMFAIIAVAVMIAYARFWGRFCGSSRAAGTADSREKVTIVSSELTTPA